jgi:hypothetical protein
VAVVFSPTVVEHEPFVTVPEAAFALGIFIAERLETNKTNGINEETTRRILRMKVAPPTANPI